MTKYKIKLSKTFKKSFKKLNNSERELFYQITQKLLNGENLAQKYKDHALSGNLKDFRECHLKPDLLLIYQIKDNELILYCFDIGSHSELFGK